MLVLLFGELIKHNKKLPIPIKTYEKESEWKYIKYH